MGQEEPRVRDSHVGLCNRRIVLKLEYEGTDYSGFQWQSNAPSIQGEVERAIKELTGEVIRIRGASRTDAGAHAKGQVVDFLTHALYTTETFLKALNWYLPPAIKVREVWQVSPDFNSRKNAVSRVYRYTVVNARSASAILRGFSHWVREPLDVDRMREAAGSLVGVHDFSALAASLPPDRSGIRTVYRWDIRREEEMVLIDSEANGFLPHQIRRTNGLLMQIGLGRMNQDVIRGIVEGEIPELLNCPAVPAKGLCLMKVNYLDLSPKLEE